MFPDSSSLQPLSLYERIASKAKQVRLRGNEPVALAYGRKSFVKMGQVFISTGYHEEICKEFCDSLGLRMEWYADDKPGHQSGRSEKNRPEWQRLKDQVIRPEVILVCCENLRAVFRNTKLILTYIDEWVERGLDVEFVDISMPTNDVRTPDGRAMLTVKSAFDESESRRATARGKMHVKAVRRAGGVWGKAAMGLVARGKGGDRKLFASPEGYYLVTLASGESVPVVAKKGDIPFAGGVVAEWRSYIGMVETWLRRYVAGTRFRYGARDLNAEGWFLQNEANLPRRVRFYDLRRIIFRTLHNYQGVLPDDLMEQALAIRSKSKRYRQRVHKNTRQLLSGMLFCDKCGRGFITRYRHDGTICYDHRHEECSASAEVKCEFLDKWFWEHIAPRLMLTEEEKQAARKYYDKRQSQSEKKTLSERASLQVRLKRLGQLYEDLVIDDTDYKTKSTPLIGRLRELKETEVQELSAVPVEISIDRLDRIARELYSVWVVDPARANVLLLDVFRELKLASMIHPDGYHPSYLKYQQPHAKTDRRSPKRMWQIVEVIPHPWMAALFADFKPLDIIAENERNHIDRTRK